MLFSIALIIICGYTLGRIFEILKLPALVGMLICGIILGPAVFNIISPNLLHIAPDLREIALIIILARAGLSIDLNDLKAIGRPALLMCFVPAICEIAAVTLIAPIVFNISYIEAAIMGCILAPVSAAVVVPRMLKLMKNHYGEDKKIAHLIMAGTSVDDVFVIVLYVSLIELYFDGSFNAYNFIKIPLSIILGILLGIVIGIILSNIFQHIKIKGSLKVILFLAVSFMLVTFENTFPQIPVSALLAIMVMGGTILKKNPKEADTMSQGLTHLWDGAQIMLFALVGCAVQIEYINKAGIFTFVILIAGSLLRFGGVFLCLIKTKLNFKERLFCGIAYIPKATVQAAMGVLPLSMGMPSGETTLAVTVLAILILAPIGALLIDVFYKRLLNK